jgi:wobble nucleotide-excising tRNase
MINDAILEHKYKILMENLHRLLKEIYVYECGIKETDADISTFEAMLEANKQAKEFLRGAASVVAMRQYARINKDCLNILDAIKRRRDSIKIMNNEIKNRKKEADAIKILVNKLKTEMVRGKVLTFKKDANE